MGQFDAVKWGLIRLNFQPAKYCTWSIEFLILVPVLNQQYNPGSQTACSVSIFILPVKQRQDAGRSVIASMCRMLFLLVYLEE